MKEDTSKPEEDGTNGERQNAQHLPQDSWLVESERIEQVTTEEENGRGGSHWGGTRGRKPGGVRSSQIWLAVAFHRFVVRAYPSSGRESEKIDCSREGGGVVGTCQRRTGVSKRKRKTQKRDRVCPTDSCFGQVFGRDRREKF